MKRLPNAGAYRVVQRIWKIAGRGSGGIVNYFESEGPRLGLRRESLAWSPHVVLKLIAGVARTDAAQLGQVGSHPQTSHRRQDGRSNEDGNSEHSARLSDTQGT